MRFSMFSIGIILLFVLSSCFSHENYQEEPVALSGKWELKRVLSTTTDSTLASGATIEFLDERRYELDRKNGTVLINEYLYAGGERLVLRNILHNVYEYSDEKLTISGAPAIPFSGQGKLSFFERVE